MKLSQLKLNPGNPRTIDKKQLERLKRSIVEFEKMMELRPMVVDENNVLLGGNMRFQALKALGYKEIPNEWVKQVIGLTEAEKREFIIKDNLSFGNWQWEVLQDEWAADDLSGWGLDVPELAPKKGKPETKELKPFKTVHVLLSFSPDQFDEVGQLLEQIKAIDGVSIIHGSN